MMPFFSKLRNRVFNTAFALKVFYNPSCTNNPYEKLPDYSFWRKSISRIPWPFVDPMEKSYKFIQGKTKVASAGSCFAQHIARTLLSKNYNYFLTEQPLKNEPPFSARYGNIYTARQLLQLFDRAFDNFFPIDELSIWKLKDKNKWVDAFRPTSCTSRSRKKKVLSDRNIHLAHVKKLFCELDVFIFTLGLTESWISTIDGAVYPIAPGVVTHEYDSRYYKFHNFTVTEIVADLNAFIKKLQRVNPSAKVIFTVSPVPLIATKEDRHVLLANTYSKSTLRVAADTVAAKHEHVYYFPSYELFTSHHTFGNLYCDDMREPTPSGVARAMKLFMDKFTDFTTATVVNKTLAFSTLDEDVICDEVLLDQKKT